MVSEKVLRFQGKNKDLGQLIITNSAAAAG